MCNNICFDLVSIDIGNHTIYLSTISEARKKAMKNEAKIVAEAKEEAARIMERANAEIELEKKHALDDMKQEMIAIATMMAQKVVTASIDTKVQEGLIEETLKEMGEHTWQS